MPELFLHDTLTGRCVRFTPLDPTNVRIYVCGPTVYDFAHLGNARPVVVFDALVRLLRRLYPRVTYVRNITDIDDKIIARSRASGESISAITERTIANFHRDMAALGAAPPDLEPRATEHIPAMIALIERLLANGHAYVADGHVLFAVASFAAYGCLSHRSPADMAAGARVEVAAYKRDPADFVLWKPSTPDVPGWESPWGRGRPGWHIECSAMSWKHLGTDFDIHGGGADLVFPHHENEIAQSRSSFPESRFARVWLHNGMLRVNGEKMAKSLGNFLTVRDVLAKEPGEAARLLLLKTQYRAELDFSFAALGEARRELDRFYRALDRHPGARGAAVPEAVLSALTDDFNTPAAISALHALADRSFAGEPEAAAGLAAGGALLGLLEQPPKRWFQGRGEDGSIDALIAERLELRKARDFERADAIRAELASRGILLEDGPSGTTWRRIS